MIQSKPPVTRWCDDLGLAGKLPVRIKLPLTQIQYLREVPGFRSAGHIYLALTATNGSFLNYINFGQLKFLAIKYVSLNISCTFYMYQISLKIYVM